jgi:hypothetical protein
MNLDTLSYSKLTRISSERTFRKYILVPLLNDLGAEHVQDMHGPTEHGIDIYFGWNDIFSHRRHFGIQAKIGDLICTTKPDQNRNIRTICNQIKAAFSHPRQLATSMYGKVDIHIDGYYIVITGRANKTATNYILEQRKEFPYIHLIEGEELIKIIQNRFRMNRKLGPFYSVSSS